MLINIVYKKIYNFVVAKLYSEKNQIITNLEFVLKRGQILHSFTHCSSDLYTSAYEVSTATVYS